MRAVVLLLAEAGAGRLGHARSLEHPLAGSPVWRHAMARAAAIDSVAAVRLLHPAGAAPAGAAAEAGAACFAYEPGLDPPAVRSMRRTARAWSPWAWRGGLGGATVWDELLPAAPLLAAAAAENADAVVLAGADWPLLDSALASRQLTAHAADPTALPLVFSQAPPGLSPLVLGRPLLEQLAAEARASVGTPRGHPSRRGIAGWLAYQPARARVDPIASDLNVAVPAPVRDTARRFVFDTPGGRARLARLAAALGDGFASADAAAVAAATAADESLAGGGRFAELPPLVHVELSPRRFSRGSATPPSLAAMGLPGREAMSDATLARVAAAAAGRAVTLGGLGDAACHPRLREAVVAFRAAGAAGVAVETSLQGAADRGGLERLSATVRGWGADVAVIRLNATTAAVHREANGADDFDAVSATLAERVPDPSGPRLLPAFVRTAANVAELEPFFERWWQLADHAVVERFATGGTGAFALAADASPVPMDPPWTAPLATQAKRRLTVLSDGTPCLCHQDWGGRAALGGAPEASLAERWSAANLPGLQPGWSPDSSPLCRRCFDFLLLARGESAAEEAA